MHIEGLVESAFEWTSLDGTVRAGVRGDGVGALVLARPGKRNAWCVRKPCVAGAQGKISAAVGRRWAPVQCTQSVCWQAVCNTGLYGPQAHHARSLS